MARAGFGDIKTIRSDRRSILYAWGTKNDSPKRAAILRNRSFGRLVFEQFVNNFKANINSIQRTLDRFEKDGKKIGLYAPCTNLIGLLNFKNEPRIFNGDRFKQGKYMAGSGQIIEAPENLVKKPVDVLYVAPIDYDKEICQYLQNIGLSNKKTEKISLKEIYENNSGIKYKVSSL